MNYFIVNNGFHLDDVLSLIGEERPELIIIPHLMNRDIPEANFSKIYKFPTPIRDISKAWLYTFGYFKSVKKIHREICPCKNDTLFVYTEYELLNQHIIGLFKSAGSKVVLLEEGIATLLISHQENDRKSMRTKFNQLWIRNIFHLPACSYSRIDGIDFPLMDDSTFDGFGVYTGFNSIRDIQAFPIMHSDSSQEKVLKFNDSAIIFLNEPIYDDYMRFDEYLILLQGILSGFLKNFKHVTFKFHPRETEEKRDRIRYLLLKQGVPVIETDSSAESVCLEIMPSHAASFMSAALLKVMKYGIQPIFLNHLMPTKCEMAKQVDKLLDSLAISRNISPSEILPTDMTFSILEGKRLNFVEFVSVLNREKRL